MNLPSKVPTIPIEGCISYEDWRKGRCFGREMGNRVAPGIIRRESSCKDGRLKALYNGERGLAFTPTEKL